MYCNPLVHIEAMIVLFTVVALQQTAVWTTGKFGVWIENIVKNRVKRAHEVTDVVWQNEVVHDKESIWIVVKALLGKTIMLDVYPSDTI